MVNNKNDRQTIQVFMCVMSIMCMEGGMIKNDGQAIQVLHVLNASCVQRVNGNFTVHNVHFITCGNMASNTDREIDEVKEERLRR